MTYENLYLIKLYNDRESFYKIGTSVHKFCRFYEIMKHGYKVRIVYMVLGMDFYDAINLETRLQKIFALNSYTPLRKFGGYTECFSNIPIETYKQHLAGVNHIKGIIENLEISWR